MFLLRIPSPSTYILVLLFMFWTCFHAVLSRVLRKEKIHVLGLPALCTSMFTKPRPTNLPVRFSGYVKFQDLIFFLVCMLERWVGCSHIITVAIPRYRLFDVLQPLHCLSILSKETYTSKYTMLPAILLEGWGSPSPPTPPPFCCCHSVGAAEATKALAACLGYPLWPISRTAI